MKLRILLTLDLLNVGAFAFWGPLFAVYAIRLGATASLAGGLYAIYTLIHAAAFFVFGHIDRSSRRLALVSGGYAIQAGAAVLFMVAPKPIFLLLPLTLSAIAGGMIAPSWKVLFTKAMRAGREGKSWSYYDGGEAIAIAAGTFAAGLIASHAGYRAMFWPLLALNAAAVILALSSRELFAD